MKKLFEGQNVSIYKIQKDLNLGKMRLYRYADGSLDIYKIPAQLILQLSNYFKIEPNILFKEMVDYERKSKRRNNRRTN